MKTKHFGSLLALLFMCATFWGACQKDDDTPDPADTSPIQLNCDDFKSAMTLEDDPDRPVDYTVTCLMDIEAPITIQPGVVVQFEADAGWYVRNNGSLRAVGTDGARIELTGTASTPGAWKGLLFDSEESRNQLSYVDIRYAGGGAFNSNGDLAALVLWNATSLALDHISIQQSASKGISAIYGAANWSLTQSRITGCADAPVVCLLNYLSVFDNTNDFTGNAADHILLDLATNSLTTDLTWKKSSVPYRVTSTFNLFTELTLENADVVIEAGTQIQMEDGTGLRVDRNSSLQALGTADAPIQFSGVTPSAGAWSAIYFDANATLSNELRHVNIRHAGAELDNEKSAVLMRVNPTLRLDHVNFTDIDGCSIYNKDVQLNPNLTTSNLTHTNTTGEFCND